MLSGPIEVVRPEDDAAQGPESRRCYRWSESAGCTRPQAGADDRRLAGGPGRCSVGRSTVGRCVSFSGVIVRPYDVDLSVNSIPSARGWSGPTKFNMIRSSSLNTTHTINSSAHPDSRPINLVAGGREEAWLQSQHFASAKLGGPL